MGQLKKIVVVGGGAGGLELATKLGKTLGKKRLAEIILLDRNPTHLWKPLLHEVATGVIDEGVDALNYAAHGKQHGYHFVLGTLVSLDRECKLIQLAPLLDNKQQLLLPERQLSYDMLVMALGSTSNDFSTPGVKEHCVFLDNHVSALAFHERLLELFLKHSVSPTELEPVKVAIVGAGATGVELSAELYNVLDQLQSYGFNGVDNHVLQVTLIESAPRILGALPEKMAEMVSQDLVKLGVNLKTGMRVINATETGVNLANGEFVEADIMVWAAGVKVPDQMKDIGGLETNRINQLVVNPNLTTTRDNLIFAIGDCASCPLPEGGFVPPRAQSAHQMASQCYDNIMATLHHKPLKDYRYQDHGTLVSLSRFNTIGNLMNGKMIKGKLARLAYISLYRMHQVALHGYIKTCLIMLVSGINRFIKPKLKLH